MINFPKLSSGETPFWNGQCFQCGEKTTAVLHYSTNFEGWNANLTTLHEVEAGDGQHPIDKTSRKMTLRTLKQYLFPEKGNLLEIGCSSGFMLKELQQTFPNAHLVGSDVIPLEPLSQTLKLPLVQMDITASPFESPEFDAIIALNVLEHIKEDEKALENMAALLKPQGLLILEIPQGSHLYDYFDAFLQHARRYDKTSLLNKLKQIDLEILNFNSLGFTLYPLFFLLKKWNRLRFGVKGEKLANIEHKVRQQIHSTAQNKWLDKLFALEFSLSNKYQFSKGIRYRVVLRKA